MPAADMLYIFLPALLTVNPCFSIFHLLLPALASLYTFLSVISMLVIQANSFSPFFLRFPVFEDIYIYTFRYHSIDILCIDCFILCRNCLIFLFNRGSTACLITDDIITFINFADLHYFFTDIKLSATM